MFLFSCIYQKAQFITDLYYRSFSKNLKVSAPIFSCEILNWPKIPGPRAQDREAELRSQDLGCGTRDPRTGIWDPQPRNPGPKIFVFKLLFCQKYLLASHEVYYSMLWYVFSFPWETRTFIKLRKRRKVRNYLQANAITQSTSSHIFHS